MASENPEWKDAFANQLFTTDSPADNDFNFDANFQADQMASGSADYTPAFSDSLFQQFTNFSDSPGTMSDGVERHDSTATVLRRDTVVPMSASNFLMSADTSTHHSPASSASPAHIKRETPESDANGRNLMSSTYQSGMPVVGSSPLDFGSGGVDGLEDFDTKGMFVNKRDMTDFEAMSSSTFWDSPSTITAGPSTIGNPLHSISASSFDALTSTPQASTFQVLSHVYHNHHHLMLTNVRLHQQHITSTSARETTHRLQQPLPPNNEIERPLPLGQELAPPSNNWPATNILLSTRSLVLTFHRLAWVAAHTRMASVPPARQILGLETSAWTVRLQS